MTQKSESERMAAKEMVSGASNEFRLELIVEGVYHVVVEGGYHSQSLTDEEADRLCRVFVEDGLNGWEEHAYE